MDGILNENRQNVICFLELSHGVVNKMVVLMKRLVVGDAVYKYIKHSQINVNTSKQCGLIILFKLLTCSIDFCSFDLTKGHNVNKNTHLSLLTYFKSQKVINSGLFLTPDFCKLTSEIICKFTHL